MFMEFNRYTSGSKYDTEKIIIDVSNCYFFDNGKKYETTIRFENPKSFFNPDVYEYYQFEEKISQIIVDESFDQIKERLKKHNYLIPLEEDE